MPTPAVQQKFKKRLRSWSKDTPHQTTPRGLPHPRGIQMPTGAGSPSDNTETNDRPAAAKMKQVEGSVFAAIVLIFNTLFGAPPVSDVNSCLVDAVSSNSPVLDQFSISISSIQVEALPCPPNSHYESCAPPCQPSCVTTPPGQCMGPCAEGCVCDPGYVLSAGKCVKEDSCGCQHTNGQYYQPGEVFYTADCDLKCTCNPPSVDCDSGECPPSQQCGVQGGILGCHPITTSTCVASGDPHYTTFDELKYDFMGTCTYLMSKPCNTTSMPHYEVHATNENRNNNDRVSYVAEVLVYVHGMTLSILKGGIFRINGTNVNLPVNPAPDVSVYKSGKHYTVGMSFGVTVRYDGNHYMDIKVTSAYKEKVCGLCGDYDGNPGNDFLTPTGELVTTPNDFGNSWNTDPKCDNNPEVPLLGCTPEDEEKYEAPAFCGIIQNTNGPFAVCHSIVNSDNFFKDCTFDLCELDGLESALCEAIEAYVNECQDRGVTIEPWRSATFCPLTCPPNSHYESCAPPCQPSCVTPPPTQCIGPCAEGCVCDEGYVLSAGKCVQEDSCGCQHTNGLYYEPGEVFYTADCDLKCTCNPPSVDCDSGECPPSQQCGVQGGILGCHPITTSTCVASGDPHYTTFDELKYDFMGTCTYLMSKPCNTTSMPHFEVHATNENRNNNDRVSYVAEVLVYVHGMTLSILKGGIFRINGTNVNLPVNPAPDVSVYKSGKHYTVGMSFGVTVRYDGNHYMDIKVTSAYKEKVCGLCGDYDGNPGNDFLTPTGELVTTPNDFGNSWNTDPKCDNNPEVPLLGCTPEDEEKYEAPAFCGIIQNTNGPFAVCHSIVNSDNFFKDCTFDLCELDGLESALCEAIEAYVNECQDRGVTIEPWRSATFCPLTCPPNSHYESCAPPCQPSCVTPPPAQCIGPCAEGCVCDEGYVLSAGKCVQEDSCGCQHTNGLYYEPGEVFYTADCDLKCTCNPPSVDCDIGECPPSQQCGVQGGILGCHPITTSTCVASGDPHYTTFDELKYDFMGTCTYLMSKPCNTTSMPHYEVHATNENRNNNDRVSYVAEVLVYVHGMTLSILKGGIFRINGTNVNLPVNPAPDVSVYKSGKHYTVGMSFGVTVRYDGNHYMDIKVTSAYKEKVCGLCGDYDGNPGNDFLTPTGELVTTPNDFGNSWNTDPKCDNNPEVPLLGCTPEDEEKYEAPAFCGIIQNTNGPFAVCHSIVNSDNFFKDCTFDLCELDGLESALCEAIEAYVNECQDRGVTIEPWRSATFCPLTCPPNSHYESCAPPCQPSCVTPPPAQCIGPCAEGCVCDEGYVLSAGKCVQEDSCGCQHTNGLYYEPGEVFYTADCDLKCTCNPPSVDCDSGECPPSQQCGVQGGILGCHPITTSTCVASGDPHYTTFDELKYDFMGTCTYLMSKPCNTTSMPHYEVHATNENRNNNDRVSYVAEVLVYVHGMTLSILKGGIFRINGTNVNLPVNPAPDVSVYKSGKHYTVGMSFGVTVRYDGNHYMDIKVTSAYKEKVCGLCGDYDGNPGNDFLTPTGELVTTPNDFGNSWNTDPKCDNNPEVPLLGCTPEDEEKYEAPAFCGIIQNTNGPFAVCHSIVNSDNFFKDCTFDLCELDGLESALCEAIEAYVNECQDRGVTIEPWRSATFCPLTCPPNSHYESCAPPCQPSCVTPPPAQCIGPCAEGCVCDEGYVLSAGKCVQEDSCGCQHTNGLYYEPGEVFYTADCDLKCTCNPPSVDCDSGECPPSQQCGVQGGILGCHPITTSTCVASGDPHYTTFDELKYDFMGTCTYLMSKPCNTTSMPHYEVHATNENRNNNDRVSYVAEVLVYVHGMTLSILKGGIFRINGTNVNLPVNPAPDVSVYKSGKHYTVGMSFGVTVRYDGNHYMDIKVTSAYKEKVCGLCGDYDGNPGNDFLTPTGELVTTPNDFGNSWNTDPKCDNNPEVPLLGCTPEDEEKYEAPAFCGIIQNTNGPFAVCHSIVNSDNFFKDCTFDLCELDGLESALCEAIEAYVNECQDRGVTIEPWRSATFCPLTCPPNSHYESCAPPCQPSCVTPPPAQCIGPCAEGCVCDEGYVLSAGKCVQEDSCGCQHTNGLYYEPGEVFYTADCDLKCTCNPPSVDCDSGECPPSQQCGVQGGILGCHPITTSTCVASGDPHYTTFDELKYDFMGTCTYLMSKPCNTTSMPHYEVHATNENRNNNDRVSYVAEVLVYVHGMTLSILKGGIFRINGTNVNLPVNPAPDVSVYKSGKHYTVGMSFGVTVRYDGNHYMDIKVTSAYKEKVCGLCGDYDGNPGNDFLTPTGELVTTPNDFGNSWNTDPKCDNNPEVPLLGCTPEDEEKYEAPAFCGIIQNTNGPFAVCHSIVNSDNFFKDCTFDLCELDGLESALCEAIEAYVNECQDRGVTIEPWRSATFCPLTCPPNSHYESCAPPCQPSCVTPPPAQCIGPCAEGCVCDEGYVLSAGKCVQEDSCGCQHTNGLYYEPGEVFYTADCDLKCTCNPPSVDCDSGECPPSQQCGVQGGILGCHPITTSTCVASGDPHYTTFDELKYDFMGTCTYLMSKPCNTTSMPHYEVHATNENRNNNDRVSYVAEVLVYVHGMTLSILKGGIFRINGTNVNLPVNPAPDVSVYKSGKHYTVGMSFGVTVRYDGNHYMDIKVTSAYKEKVCGLCGDYDGNPGNDFLTPTGELVTTPNDFGNSWNTDPKCDNNPEVPLLGCTPEDEEKYEAPAFCGIIQNTNGPFAVCHSIVNSDNFFKDCTFDLCELDGLESALCEAIEAYVNECQDRGVTIEPWRSATFCPLTCPPNSHYESCAPPCQPSCVTPPPAQCIGPCAEGCVCDEGYVLSAGKCVQEDSCGCQHTNGLYYETKPKVYSRSLDTAVTSGTSSSDLQNCRHKADCLNSPSDPEKQYKSHEMLKCYKEKVCGLCGDYDGNPGNDFLTPTGELVPTPNDFGNSWNTDPKCDNNPEVPLLGCTPEDEEKYEAPAFCGIIQNTNGPFAVCHSIVNSDNFFKDCTFDLCELDGLESALCEAIEAYVNECQDRGVTIEPWRSATFCPLTCPPNSHYESCAPPCQHSCVTPPPAQCIGPCAEGCVCDEGYVLSAGKCVQEDSCGCQHTNGLYYEPGEVFYTADCDLKCTCNPPSVDCDSGECPPSQQCGVQGGILGCHPITTSTCVASGDPHYTTFDELKYDFMGTCTYLMSKPCNTTSMPHYEVHATNENRNNNDRVSYVAEVLVYVHGMTLSILKGGIFRINGTNVNLPVNPAPDVSVYKSGKHYTVGMSFGVTVRYDGNHYMDIKVTSAYKEKVCGLCGDYDGNPGNDFLTPTGELVTTPNDFGNSWNTDPKCDNNPEVPLLGCTPEDEEKYEAPAFCGIIQNTNGPFAVCHSIVNSDNFFKDCTFDLCELDGLESALCEAIEAYVNECQDRGVTIEPWRSATFCPLTCPPNSHYESCAPPCQPSCVTPPPAQCIGPCAEGCVCDEGYVLSAGKCVQEDSCGCQHTNGLYYEPGEVFYTADCDLKCTCNPPSVDCDSGECPPSQQCGVQGGILGCHPITTSTCVASGDPHYTTFDELKYDFMGTCTYLMSKPCNTTSMPHYEVHATNENRNNNDRVSYVAEVLVYVHGMTLSILKGGIFRINGTNVNLPVNPAPDVSVYKSGKHYTVGMSFGVTVRYDGNHYMDIKVTSAYKEKVCGLCGDYDGNPGNDFLTPTGELVTTPNDFGNSWNTDPKCDNNPEVPLLGCTPEDEEKYEAPAFCGIIQNTNGPFAVCHSIVNSDNFFKDCTFDLCELDGLESALCEAIEAYVNECQDRGVTIEPWRSATFCPLTCPPNSHYESCAPPCQPSCVTPPPAQCIGPCAEGCVCDEGYVLSAGKCVQEDSCGCQHTNGLYYEPGEVFYTADCDLKCTCNPPSVDCDSGECPPSQQCGVQGGILGCHPITTSTCVASGDPHYTTFDELKYDFMGTCTYLMSKPCNTTSMPHYEVHATNENRNNNDRVSYVAEVHVYVHGMTLSILKGGIFRINGTNVNLPVNPAPDVSVYKSGKHYTVGMSFGVTVRYDGNHYMDIKVTSAYKEKVCGLCGDYDGNPGNDFLTPTGELVTTPNDFGNSWNTDPKCDNNPEVPLLGCTPEDEEKYEAPAFCGIIQNTNGPFAVCHSIVNSDNFFKDCTFDLCELDGLESALCEAIEAYVNECQDRGVTIEPWRSATFCPLTCPPNSHYESCAPPCQPSCVTPPPAQCIGPCAEGCVCDEGYVLSAGKCVQEDSCGCQHTNGLYYEPGEVFYTADCDLKCTCNPPSVDCDSGECPPSQQCGVQGGILGCHPITTSTCVASGDPHYTTFDELKYDFMGTCTYLMSKPCNTTSMPHYEVHATNENRNNNDRVSYVAEVHVYVHGMTLSILKGGIFRINGTNVNVPVNPAPDVSVYKSGKHYTVGMSFGVTVRYDGNHYMDIKVTSAYKEKVCGLCGDYDGNPGNDFLTPTGELVTTPNDFGNSWNTDPKCDNNPEVPLLGCTPEDEEKYEAPAFCGIIQNTNGPFAVCHLIVNSDNFFKDCTFDLCELDGLESALCEAIEAYVNECQDRGVTIEPWRSATFCPLTCPPNSHYESCAPPCQPSCVTPPPAQCIGPCAEGCVCDEGYVLSAGKCVQEDSCGCQHTNGLYYEPGEVFYTADCDLKCTCNPPSVNCDSGECPPSQQCGVQGGILGCHPITTSTCVASGDPHYTTFDELKYDFMGTCTYLMSKPCNTTSMPHYEVHATNENRNNNDRVSYVAEVHVYVHGMTLSILKGGIFRINGTNVNLPVNPTPDVSVYKSGKHYTVGMSFGVTVRYDGNHYMDIKVTSAYKEKVCGLCGDYDGNPGNDFLTPTGELVTTPNDFGNSWNTDPKCDNNPEVPLLGCTPEDEEKYEAPAFCGIIQNTNGPFAVCHLIVNSDNFFKDCTFDLCELDGLESALCEAIEAYVNECQDRGVTIEPWRNATFCPLTCPPNSHYESCAPPCQPSCVTPPPAQCIGPCAEGCVCDEGYVLSAGKCVQEDSCGCQHTNGLYYEPGEVFYTADCDLKCTCNPPSVDCDSGECPPSQQCGVQGGILGCHPITTSTCVAPGDPHYTTFDELKYDFMGTCTYLMSKPCNTTSMPHYEVHATNENRNNNERVSYVAEVHVYVHGMTLSILKGGIFRINGTNVNLPVNPTPDVSVYKSGKHYTVGMSFGVTVRYDGNHYMDIKVTSAYKEKVCGLCGDYDGNPGNDFLTPTGELVTTPNDFGNSWNTDPKCDNNPEVPLLGCTPEDEEKYEAPAFCGIIQNTNGPFAVCHLIVNSDNFFKDCTFDLCELDGLESALCEAIEAYVNECQDRGVTIEPWRNATFCPLTCPPNSHYESCAPPCQPSCVTPPPAQCIGPCAEGCVCDEGYVLSAGKCVQEDSCGCQHTNGLYYEPGEVFYTADCDLKCTCNPPSVDCDSGECLPSQQCGVQGGILGCHPIMCGRPTLNERIVGGEDSAAGSWPWQVSLQRDLEHYCGGSLINNQWILTAAHCTDGISSADMARWTVRLGVKDLDISSANELTNTLTEVIVHPEYDDWTLDNDIALLQMSTPVTFNDYISPVCLADSNSVFHNGTASWATGWGDINEGESLPHPGTLQEVEVPVIGNRQCDCFYQPIDWPITQNMICSGLLDGGKDACQGDSGGPMVNQQNSVWIQSGLVSFGYGCAREGFPGVYTRVSSYQSWIESHITSDPPGFVQFSSIGEDEDSSFTCSV
ncbi:IgGFc-binding protein-like [Engraulis encrasicolus]|uniref:IgGFc-binding protein-like n=1 Tax=Engraulis encrasicolus TaxID=184585 RepID=UPI002FD53286